MKIIKIKSNGLSHLSYLVIIDGEAAVIDPRRDCNTYLSKIFNNDATIKYIFETHRHEDFVSGSSELSRLTSTPVFHGSSLDFEFGISALEGDTFDLGQGYFKVLNTPGHTSESISFALYPSRDSRDAVAVFTGDTLFVDDVGRTDLTGDSYGAASILYDSIHNKILPLGEQVVLYPAHGAGSVCGGKISDREVSTLGYEKSNNPMLNLNEDEFIERKINELHQKPPYFKKMEEVNLIGNAIPLKEYPLPEVYTPSDFIQFLKDGQIIDTRSAESYMGCHIPGSLAIPKELISAYAGYFLDYERNIYLIGDDNQSIKDIHTDLQRLGYDNVKGFLKSGISSWTVSGRKLESIPMIEALDIDELKKSPEITFLDVRKPSEWKEGIIEQARTIFLGDLPQQVDELERGKKIIVYCGSGKRAVIGASILLRHDFKNIHVFMGSMKALNALKK